MDLSSLKSYVDFILATTIKVQKTIQIECQEANFILRPWIIESISTRNIHENNCICKSVSFFIMINYMKFINSIIT